jgi:hypothetical protein
MVHVASRGGSDGYAAGLSGRLGGEVLDIEAVLHFHPSSYPVSRALFAGELLGQGFEARVVPGEAAGDAREAYIVTGGLYVGSERVSAKHARFAVASPMPFAFYVAVDSVLGRVALRGHTSSGAACVDIAATSGRGEPISISGFFEGPTEILLLLVATALQWVKRRPKLIRLTKRTRGAKSSRSRPGSEVLASRRSRPDRRLFISSFPNSCMPNIRTDYPSHVGIFSAWLPQRESREQSARYRRFLARDDQLLGRSLVR